MKAVSIILPVYGVEKYIGDCIRSVIGQTFHDFELIIVDDQTKDNSIKIADDLLKNSDIDYKIIHRENGGLSAARNTGIKNATGEYLVCVDSDDVIHPDYLRTLYTDAKNNNVDLSIAGFKWVKDESKFDFDNAETTGEIVDKKEFLNKILKRKVFPYFGCFLVRRKYIIDNNLYHDEDCLYNVDHAYQWRLMVGVDKYTYNPKKIYNYYNRPGSIMTGTKLEKMYTGIDSVKRCIYDLQANPFFDSHLILTRYDISVLHTMAKLKQNFQYFESLYEKMDINPIQCLKYPDYRIKALAIPMVFGKHVLFSVLRRV